MEGAPRIPPALRRLVETARGVVGRAPTMLAAVARLEGVVLPEHLPEADRPALQAAIADARAETAWPLPLGDVERILRAEWGEGADRVLDALDPEPMAVEAHAQTHRGSLDGEAVLVRVGRPGLAASARSDLSLLDLMAAPARAAFPALDVGPLIREVRERAVDELDFEHEAALQRRVGRALRGVQGVSVAPVVSDRCTELVWVAREAKGTPLTAARALDGVDRPAAARAIALVFCAAPTALGAVLADARATDIVVAPDGALTLQWVGAGREVDPRRLEAAAGAAQALRTDDPETFALALGALGLLAEEDALRAHALLRDLLGPLAAGPAVLDAAAIRAVAERARARSGEVIALATRARLDPSDLWAGRALVHTVSLLARLEVQDDWIPRGLAALRGGWD